MTAAAFALALLYGGLLFQGYRDPLVWSSVSVVIWGVLFFKRRALATRPAGLWAAFLVWASLSALFSGQPLKSLPALSRWASYVGFLALAQAFWKAPDRRRWVWLLCASALPLAVASFVTGWDLLSLYGQGETMWGLLPRYYNYTAFALAASGAAAFAAASHPDAPKGRLRWALWSVVLCSAVVVTAARARGALLALMCGLVVAAWRRGKIGQLKRAALALILVAGAFTAVMAARGKPISFLLKLDKAQFFTRPQIWKAALATAAEHSLFGQGPGQFENGFLRHTFPSRYRITNYQFTTAYAHSEPLQLLAETGIVGLALFLLALIGSLRGLGNTGPLHEEAALAALGAMGAQLCVDNMLQLPVLGLLFFSALACLQSGQSASKTPGRSWAFAAVLGAALSSLAWLPQWRVDRLAATQGSAADQLEAALKAAALFPLDAGRHEAVGQAWLSQTPPRYDQALEAFTTASELSPKNAIYLVWRAELLRQEGRWEKVGDLAQRAIALEPNFLQARLLLAETQARSGMAAQALAELAEVARRREELAAARLYVPHRKLYTGYDRLIAAFDEQRFKGVQKLAMVGL